MEWSYNLLIASGCTPEHASMATAIAFIIILTITLKGIFSALFPKR